MTDRSTIWTNEVREQLAYYGVKNAEAYVVCPASINAFAAGRRPEHYVDDVLAANGWTWAEPRENFHTAA